MMALAFARLGATPRTTTSRRTARDATLRAHALALDANLLSEAIVQDELNHLTTERGAL